jgi:hypothetical protein
MKTINEEWADLVDDVENGLIQNLCPWEGRTDVQDSPDDSGGDAGQSGLHPSG